MADKIFRWQLPTTRVDGKPLSAAEIQHVEISLDVGAGFGVIANVPPNTLSLLQTELDGGDYVVRGVVVPISGGRSTPVDVPFSVAFADAGPLLSLIVE